MRLRPRRLVSCCARRWCSLRGLRDWRGAALGWGPRHAIRLRTDWRFAHRCTRLLLRPGPRRAAARRHRAGGRRVRASRCRLGPRAWRDDWRLALDEADIARCRRIGGRRMRHLRRHAAWRRHSDDRAAGAGHERSALREALRERVVIDGRYRRRSRGDDAALSQIGRRANRRCALPRCITLAHRRDSWRARVDLSIAPLLRVDALSGVSDRAALHESGGRHGGDGTRRAIVHIRVMDVVDVDIRDVDVPIVNDGLIDALKITGAPAAVSGPPDFSWAERKPGNARRRRTAYRQPDAPARSAASAADERNQCGRVDGRRADHGARHPTP